MSNRNANLIQAIRKRSQAALGTFLYGSSTGGNATVPTHAVGDLLVSVIIHPTSATPPTLTGWGSPLVAEAHTTGSQSIAVYAMIATATNHTAVWTGGTGLRAVWVIPGGKLPTNTKTSFGTTTAFTPGAQPAITPNSAILCMFTSTSAQASHVGMDAVVAGGITQRTSRLTAASAWSGDSLTNNLSSFGGAGMNGTLAQSPTRWSFVSIAVETN